MRSRVWTVWCLGVLLCAACSDESGGADAATTTDHHPDLAEDAGHGEEPDSAEDPGAEDPELDEDGGDDASSDPAAGLDAGGDSLKDGAAADAASDGRVPSPEAGAPKDAGVDTGVPVVRGPTNAKPNDAAEYLFDATKVRTYNIVVAQGDLRKLDEAPAAEVYVPASLEFEGKKIENLRVRYKGGYGAFLPPCTGDDLLATGVKTGKCSIKLAFDQVDSEGRFYGLRKLNFHSMNRDASMLRDRLGYSLFRDSGLVAPRSVHARVLINGKLEGLFALVEQIDGRFTRSRFTEGGEGNLYKEIWPIHRDRKAYVDALETNEDESPSVDGMLNFKAAIERSASAAQAFVDRDYLMKYIAVDRVIINDDGVFHWWCVSQGAGNNPGGVGNHNYYWYQESAREFFWLIPWDFDNAFNAAGMVVVWPEWNERATCSCASTPSSFVPQLPASCDPLTQHFITWTSDYDRHVEAFLSGPFAAAAVKTKLDAWVAQLRPHVVEAAGRLGEPSERAWDEAVRTLRTTVDAARANRGYRY
jgi:spore coat protein H